MSENTEAVEPEVKAAPEETPATEKVTETTPDPASEPGLSLHETLSAKYDELTTEGEAKEEVKEDSSSEEDKEASEPEKEAEQDEEAKEPESPAIEPPSSWSKEMKAKWADVPPETQEFILKRETEAHTAITKLGQEVNSFKPLQDTLNHYSEVFKVNNLKPEQGVAKLLEVQSLLDKDPEDGIKQIAKAYNVDLEKFAFEDLQEDAPEITSMRNEISELRQQLDQQNAYNRQQAEHAEQLASQERMEAVERFAADKPDFDKLQNEILINVTSLRETKPGLTPQEYLEQAYKIAQLQNDETRAAFMERQAKEAQEAAKAKAEQAAKAASLNVSSSGIKDPSPTSIRDEYDRIWANHNR